MKNRKKLISGCLLGIVGIACLRYICLLYTSGNREFVKAKESTEQMVQELSKSYPEVKDFVQEFLPAYAKKMCIRDRDISM